MPRSLVSRLRPSTARTALSGRFPAFANAFNCSNTANLDIARVAGNTTAGATAVTFVVGVKFLGSANGGGIFETPAVNSTHTLWLKNTNNGNNQFRINSGNGLSAGNYDITTYTFPVNKRMVCAVRYTGSAIEVWVDQGNGSPSLISSTACTGTISSGVNTDYLLNSGQAASRHNAQYYFARVWLSSLSNANLTAAMTQNYKVGAVMNLDMSEGSGTPADHSSNAATVTIQGSGQSWVAGTNRTRVL